MNKDGESDHLEPTDNFEERKNHREIHMGRHPGQDGGGMTLEDDVESMLSENHLNQSNSSMFRVRHAHQAGLRIGEELGQGDSTYRAHEDSILGMENDKDIISESDEGGWYQSEKDGGAYQKHGENEDDLSDISENSQDDDDSEGDDPNGSPNKKKLKGEKKKKRKKKKEEAEALEKQAAEKTKAENTKGKPIIDAYKELAKDTKAEKSVKPAAQVK